MSAALVKVDEDVLQQAVEQHAGGETSAGAGTCSIRNATQVACGITEVPNRFGNKPKAPKAPKAPRVRAKVRRLTCAPLRASV